MFKRPDGLNKALFCCMCGISTDQGHEIGRVFLRSVQKEELPCSAICGDCIGEAFSLLNLNESENPVVEKIPNIVPLSPAIQTPGEIFKKLSQSVVGQESAKRAVSNAISWHQQRIFDKNLSKSNVLIIGPTGTGKTELARAAAKLLDLPFVICDATTFTAHGYVGEDVESCLTRLYSAAENNLERAQTGIVFIDEIDKIADRDMNNSIGTTSVQQALLKLLEGTTVNVPKSMKQKNGGMQEYIQMDTSRILFICAGAFSGITDKELNSKSIMGLGLEKKSAIQDKKDLSQKNLVNYGFIPEFLGRFKIITKTDQLDESALLKILKLPRNSVPAQYQRILRKYGVELTFSEDFLKSVAKEAISSGLGARGLSRILESKLETILFEAPDYPEEKRKITL